jgi:hypothetical protein
MNKNVDWGEVTNPYVSAFMQPAHVYSRDRQVVGRAKVVVLGFLSSRQLLPAWPYLLHPCSLPQPTLGDKV